MSRISVRSLIEHRAKILAMVQFTSRSDLQASDFPEDGGLDLLVRIVPDGPGYQKFFGVQLRGTKIPLPSSERATRYLGNTNFARKSEGKLSLKYSFPVIVLVFSMEDDKGYFAWSIEPFVNRSGRPKLKLLEEPSCAPFDRSALATIVNRVNDWHDSLVALLETV
jgi:hypothetical protein